MSQYSELMGSFIRNGNFPLEADYIFNSKEQLEQFYSTDLNKTLLHKGWFKIVDEGESQSLYWVVEVDGELKFTKLISEGSLDDINEWLSELQITLDEEISKREEKDEDEQKRLEYLEESIKAIVGSDDSVKEYLETLDYKNLTELSNELNKFINTYDDEDESINTLPELKDFLKGYTYKHNLQEVLEDLWNKIEGDPTPNLQFRTLRGIQDFITLLASETKHRDDNLQTEINQTQTGVGLDADGSYSPDNETYYLKNATSVMNALRILDSLINEAINNCNIQAKNTNTVNVDITKEPTKTTISANVKISPESGNDIQSREDGIYHNIDSEYKEGILTIKVNGNVRQQHVLGLSSVVDDAYYDSDKESIVIIFKLQSGDKQTVNIPVSTLITEWEIDNSQPNKVVELSKNRVVAGGADKLSADVRLSSNKYNILEKDGNTLLVKGTSDNIIYDGDVTVKSKLDSISQFELETNKNMQTLTSDLHKEVDRATLAEQELAHQLTDEITRATDSEKLLDHRIDDIQTSLTDSNTEINSLKEKTNQLSDDLVSLRSDVVAKDTELASAIEVEKNRAETAESVLENKIETVKENIETNISTQISSIQDSLNNEINRSTQEDNDIRDKVSELTINVQSEINRATASENLLSQRIDTLKDSIDSNFTNDDFVKKVVDELKLDNITQDSQIKALDEKIQNVKDNVESTVNTQISSISQALNNEIQRSTQEDVDIKNKLTEFKSDLTLETVGLINNVKDSINDVKSEIDLHKVNYNNPHNVTKAQIGLDKVDNTTDYEKPISRDTQAALNVIHVALSEKADQDSLLDHVLDHTNPHMVTKEQIGLGNVDNTTDLDKPISLATQIALDKKSDIGHTHTMTDITDLENLPIVKGFVELVSDLPENAAGGDKYILLTKVGSGVTRYTLCEFDGSNGTWKQKLLTTGGVATVIDGDVWKMNSSGLERMLDVSDYTYFYNKIYDETKDLIEDIDWEVPDDPQIPDDIGDDEQDKLLEKKQIRLKITYKTKYGDPNESEVTNPYKKKNVKYIDIEKARFLKNAYSRPAEQQDVDNGYATKVGEPMLILIMTTGDYVAISLKDALNIYDPIDTDSIDMTITDWTGNKEDSYKVSAVIRIASIKGKETGVSLHVNSTTNDKGMYATLHTSNTNCITLNPSTGTSGQKTLSATLELDNDGINNVNTSNILLTKESGGLAAQFIWGEYE